MSNPDEPVGTQVDPSEGSIDEGEGQQSIQAAEGDGEDAEVADNAQAAE
jgi:hypothetical protein